MFLIKNISVYSRTLSKTDTLLLTRTYLFSFDFYGLLDYTRAYHYLIIFG